MRHFTPDEANAALDRVRPSVERLVERRRRVVAAATELEALRARVAGNGVRSDPARVAALEHAAHAAATELAASVQELSELGVQVKDLDTGLVDFPAVHPESGETVLLCWRLGEDAVAWWHRVEDGFAGRKPLPF
jgi:hypothetical protein